MSKATHMLAMAGMALVAGAAFGASPAAAAPAAPQASTSATSSAAAPTQSQPGDRFGGYYRTRGACERVGRAGVFIGRWNSYECDPVRRGPRHGWWVLTLTDRWHGDSNGGDWGHHHNGGDWGHHNGGDWGHHNGGDWGHHHGGGQWGHHRGDMRGR
jgi:hypothetical protein